MGGLSLPKDTNGNLEIVGNGRLLIKKLFMGTRTLVLMSHEEHVLRRLEFSFIIA
jgi:hypothetical protein